MMVILRPTHQMLANCFDTFAVGEWDVLCRCNRNQKRLENTVALLSYALGLHFLRNNVSSCWASEWSDVNDYKWRLNPDWHRMLYSMLYPWQQWASKG